jgi:hypothetical protein
MFDTIRSVIYGLLAHPQLSIRENATHAFSAYLFRSELSVWAPSSSLTGFMMW